MQAVDGKPKKSGVAVATTIRSTSSGAFPALASAARAASTARSLVTEPSAAKWRAPMPVWERIHSSVVSTRSDSSSFVTRFAGIDAPVPAIVMAMLRSLT